MLWEKGSVGKSSSRRVLWCTIIFQSVNYHDPNPILINHSLRKYPVPEGRLLMDPHLFSQYLKGVYKKGGRTRQTVTGQGEWV